MSAVQPKWVRFNLLHNWGYWRCIATLARQNNNIFALSHREANNKIRIHLMKGQPVREKNETITSTPSLATHARLCNHYSFSILYMWNRNACISMVSSLCSRFKLWCNSNEVRKSHFLCVFSQWLICQRWNCLKVRSELYWDWSWTPSLCLSVWLYILITFRFEDWCATSVISSLFVYFVLLLFYYIKIMVLINLAISTLIRLFIRLSLWLFFSQQPWQICQSLVFTEIHV